MDFQLFIDWVNSFYQQYPLFCYVAGGALLLLSLWKPRKVLRSLLLALVLMVILYISFWLIDSINFGKGLTEKGIQRSEQAIEQQAQ